MKYCAIILVFFLLAVSPAIAQKKCLRKFYREQRRNGHGETFKIGLGRVTLKFASLVIPANVMEEDGIPLKHLLSKVHRLKLYTIAGNPQDSTVETAAIERLKQTLVEKEHFESLVEVRHQGSIVHLMNKGKGDDVGNLVVLIQDENDFVILHLRTDLEMKDINQLVQQFAKN
ncbi:protein of unknown function [Chitinophaga sp. CF118]|uniref:DUF4252 domain-containing protein n=1 Tax=Chitinophaga sp. CF118 TaxID=1884367 RepID=UPI0008E40980|nr:DUF4252 domain-containing protein [Chitinophaga sp. CF118]SFD52643.1 protein of unknown function [Chitinophaga sp. CF118]